MKATINDAIRQLIIKNFSTLIGEDNYLWLILSENEGKSGTSIVDNRAPYTSIGSKIIYQKDLIINDHIFKALLKESNITQPADTTLKPLNNDIEAYISNDSGLVMSSFSNLWNAIFINVPLEEINDPDDAKYYNTITLVIAQKKDNGEANLEETKPSHIVLQTYISKTTLPDTLNKTLEILLPF